MGPHLDHHRIVFWVDDEPSYHEPCDIDVEVGTEERGRCGTVARSRAHECTALVAEVMGLRPCRLCQRVVTRELADAGDDDVRARSTGSRSVDDAGRVRAVIFDTDGVVTRTATVHEGAWRALFDRYLQARSDRSGETFVPFSNDDYLRFVDGKPRFDGVASFLQSREIELEWGSLDDDPEDETICGLGNRKNLSFLDELRRNGAAPYESTLVLVRRLRDLDIPVAVVSASENCEAVLEAAGATGLFAARVDGVDAARMGLAGKPDPALFLEAARRLGEEPAGCTVVEDALAGVEAGRRGGFGAVVGVDRTGHPAALADHGADVVVPDLSWIDIGEDGCWQVATTTIRRGEVQARG